MLALIDSLPSEAACWGPDTNGWTQQHELLAQQVEVVDAWGRVLYATLYAAHANGKTPKLPPPVEIDHPGRRISRDKPEVERDPDRIKQFFSTL